MRISGCILGALVVIAGCASVGITVPPSLEGAERMAVEGRGGWNQTRQFTFGPFEAVDIERSWTRGRGWRVAVGRTEGGRDGARQTYAFTLNEAGRNHGRASCESLGSRGRLGVRSIEIDLDADEGLHCTRVAVEGDDAEEPPWELTLHARHDRHMEGTLVVGHRRYTLVGTGFGGKFTPADTWGYEIRSGDDAVGAVETVNRGAVWLSPELPAADRPTLAAAAAALLLYQKLQDD